MTIAGDLGLGAHELVEDRRGALGVGSQLRLWRPAVPIRGQVATWGPHFVLSPAFVEVDVFLLGRADFFPAFTITFEETPGGPVVHLDTR